MGPDKAVAVAVVAMVRVRARAQLRELATTPAERDREPQRVAAEEGTPTATAPVGRAAPGQGEHKVDAAAASKDRSIPRRREVRDRNPARKVAAECMMRRD